MPAGAAVIREVGNYDHHHGALKQLEEQRLANGTYTTAVLCSLLIYAFGFYA